MKDYWSSQPGSQYLRAIEDVLRRAGEPLTTSEIRDRAAELGLLEGLSGDRATLGAILSRDLRRGSERFVREGSKIGLRDWSRRG